MMMTLGLLLVAMGGGGLLVHAWPGFWRWLRAGRRVEPDGRVETCALCAVEVTGDEIHTVTTRRRDHVEAEFIGGAGTATRSYCCPRCCPGGCDRRHVWWRRKGRGARPRARIAA